MTKILLITNTEDVTSDFIVRELSKRDIAFYRLNTDLLFNDIQLNLDFNNNTYTIVDYDRKLSFDLNEVKCVFYRRPELPNLNDRGLSEGEQRYVSNELLFCLEGLYKILSNAFWLNNVTNIREAENKIYQLTVAKSIGFNIPQSLISNSPKDIEDFTRRNERFIVKPIKSGLINSNPSKIAFTTEISKAHLNENALSAFPNYFQHAIAKAADIRVTVVKNDIFSAEIVTKQSDDIIDWRAVSPENIHYNAIALPDKIKQQCVDITQYFKLNFSAIDLVRDVEGEYHFLEINPNGQWAWLENKLNFGISKAIVDIFEYEAAV